MESAVLPSFEFKVVLLGDYAVGKSSIALRFVKGMFHETHESTIGAAYLTQTIKVDNALVKFNLWVCLFSLQ